MSEEKEMNKDSKEGPLERILALTGAIIPLGLNSLTMYSLMEKAGIYEPAQNSEAFIEGISAMFKYCSLNLPVVFCATAGGFVIGRYIGSKLDKLKRRKKLMQKKFNF